MSYKISKAKYAVLDAIRKKQNSQDDIVIISQAKFNQFKAVCPWLTLEQTSQQATVQ